MKTRLIFNPLLSHLLWFGISLGFGTYLGLQADAPIQYYATAIVFILVLAPVFFSFQKIPGRPRSYYVEGAVDLESNGFIVSRDIFGRELRRWPLASLQDCTLSAIAGRGGTS